MWGRGAAGKASPDSHAKQPGRVAGSLTCLCLLCLVHQLGQHAKALRVDCLCLHSHNRLREMLLTCTTLTIA